MTEENLEKLNYQIGSDPTYNNKGYFGYTSEVGRGIANYCEFEDSELLSLDSQTIFTWIGKLHNTAIANNLKLLGINATPKSFCLQFDGRLDPGETLNVLQNVCSSVADVAVAESLPIEALADCGAHHRCLSDEAQQQSRHDWIDMDFVTDWINRIDKLTPVLESNRFFDDLKLLAEV